MKSIKLNSIHKLHSSTKLNNLQLPINNIKEILKNNLFYKALKASIKIMSKISKATNPQSSSKYHQK